MSTIGTHLEYSFILYSFILFTFFGKNLKKWTQNSYLSKNRDALCLRPYNFFSFVLIFKSIMLDKHQRYLGDLKGGGADSTLRPPKPAEKTNLDAKGAEI